jgi:hypothetical protein
VYRLWQQRPDALLPTRSLSASTLCLTITPLISDVFSTFGCSEDTLPPNLPHISLPLCTTGLATIMTSLATIALPSQNELDLFCSINKTSRVSVAKLAFATVLHQFFDLTEFTYAEALPNDHDDNTHYLTTGSQKVQYASDIASTTSICTALGVGKPLRSSDDDSPPLLANHTKNTTPNDQVDANGLSAGLVLTRTTYTTEEKLYSSIDERHVRSFCSFTYSCGNRLSVSERLGPCRILR